MHQPGWQGLLAGEAGGLLAGADVIRRHRAAGLDFHRLQASVHLEHQIRFQPVVVAPEIQIRRQPCVEAGFQELTYHPRLEHRAAQRMQTQGSGVADAQQPARQAGIDEVQLGRLDQPLAEIAVVGWQQEHQIAGLQHRQPGACGVVGDTRLAGQGADVEQLSGAGRAQAQESLERGKILHVQHLPHVALHVGGDIGGKPVPRLQVLGVKRRVHAPQHQSIQLQRPDLRCRQLRQRQWQQPGHAHPPGKRLGHTGQQAELL